MPPPQVEGAVRAESRAEAEKTKSPVISRAMREYERILGQTPSVMMSQFAGLAISLHCSTVKCGNRMTLDTLYRVAAARGKEICRTLEDAPMLRRRNAFPLERSGWAR